MAAKDSQILPSKEQGLFRQVVKYYETKQYKKALKAADQVLKKHADHGETLSMKGLIISSQDSSKKEEAYDLAKKGIKNNLKSHVTWHVFGLIYRADLNYDEAIKCYKNALRMDKENYQILRDLSHLQIQLRDIAGFVDTRATMLQLKPGNKSHWISFAIAHHLNGSHDIAAEALKKYEGLQEEVAPNEAYEHSEMLLYRAMVLEEGGHFDEALTHLDLCQDKITDKLGLLERRASLLLKIPGRAGNAEANFRKLLALNPDNYRYHDGLREALQLQPDAAGAWTDQQRRSLAALYDGLAKDHPQSSAAKRIPLDFKEGADFKTAADKYVRHFLSKGIPSLFSDLKGFYSNPQKHEALGELMHAYMKALEETGAFPPFPGQAEVPARDPQAREWVLFYLAQHHDKLGETGEALRRLQQCRELAPTLPELYAVQGRILKHAGDPEGAAAVACRAESMDLADRYLNSVAAKALFRAGRIEEAEAMAAKFTKHGDQVNSLTEMQAMWYEIECGHAHLCRRAYGKALKILLAVVKHFDDFQEDQFDFHAYCVRKMTLRAYVQMLRMEDSIYQNIFYSKAAWAAIQVYLELHQKPTNLNHGDDDLTNSNLSPEELKKLKLKRKKEQQKAKKEEAAREREAEAAAAQEREAAKQAAKEKGGSAKKQAPAKEKEKDPDPHGEKLAQVEDPLGEAMKLLQRLREYSGDRLKTHELAFEVYTRRKRWVLALHAVKRATAIAGPGSPEAHCMVLRFCHAAQSQQGIKEAQPVVAEVVGQELKGLLHGKSMAQCNEAFLEAHGSASLAHRAAAARMMVLLDPGAKSGAAKMLVKRGGLIGGGVAAEAITHSEAQQVHQLLADELGEAQAAADFKSKCQQVFRWSSYFEGPDRLKLDSEEEVPSEQPEQNGSHTEGAAKMNGVSQAVDKLSIH
ncbi:hypothetical protein CVIRNUC_001066 [Coccomyxa viridis]|uniref:Uncharacterized protein n=1 Tax=Coccomyxa viridis TaxID=1274662 RepID=A0AAV1HS46_9CHLO|nr:hypothetical protein CVIRNUC_001066 [Coccomyxa viridis]